MIHNVCVEANNTTNPKTATTKTTTKTSKFIFREILGDFITLGTLILGDFNRLGNVRVGGTRSCALGLA